MTAAYELGRLWFRYGFEEDATPYPPPSTGGKALLWKSSCTECSQRTPHARADRRSTELRIIRDGTMEQLTTGVRTRQDKHLVLGAYKRHPV